MQTKQDKKILEQRQADDNEQDPMTLEDMPEPVDEIDVQIERGADGSMCIKFMKAEKTK